ncbi:MAG: ATP-dependent DNA ligase [Syntrophales bacterium]|nr:ATP-dependent DNA ligase [Syntrophales bacterium]
MPFTALPIKPPFPIMDAEPVRELPAEPGWQYEPKWDGFRCLAFRDHDEIELQAKSTRSLTRYFPDIADLLKSVKAPTFVLDSELVIPVNGEFSFEDLQLRLHPAASRVRKLADEHPAVMIVFDILVDDKGRSLVRTPLEDRRKTLEHFVRRFAKGKERIQLSPATADRAAALGWLGESGTNLDGIVAKRLNAGYRSGDRTGMVKFKNIRSADCVVGGFRYLEGSNLVGSLLLGLYGDDGLLHHVGYTSSIKDADRKSLTGKLEALRQPPGFTGRSPGGPSRWASHRTGDWVPLKPELVVEVQYDHFTGGRFRHGTKFMRWRHDKSPRQCRFDQLKQAG